MNAPGFFKPCALHVQTWCQAFAFKCSLCRYAAAGLSFGIAAAPRDPADFAAHRHLLWLHVDDEQATTRRASAAHAGAGTALSSSRVAAALPSLTHAMWRSWHAASWGGTLEPLPSALLPRSRASRRAAQAAPLVRRVWGVEKQSVNKPYTVNLLKAMTITFFYSHVRLSRPFRRGPCKQTKTRALNLHAVRQYMLLFAPCLNERVDVMLCSPLHFCTLHPGRQPVPRSQIMACRRGPAQGRARHCHRSRNCSRRQRQRRRLWRRGARYSHAATTTSGTRASPATAREKKQRRGGVGGAWCFDGASPSCACSRGGGSRPTCSRRRSRQPRLVVLLRQRFDFEPPPRSLSGGSRCASRAPLHRRRRHRTSTFEGFNGVSRGPASGGRHHRRYGSLRRRQRGRRNRRVWLRRGYRRGVCRCAPGPQRAR
jgi:hypothetical protein